MRENKIQVDGSIIHWTPGIAGRDELRRGLVGLGLLDLMPGDRTDLSALAAAMKDSVNTKQFTVQALKEPHKNGYEVVRIERGESGNTYDGTYTAKVWNGEVLVTRGYADAQLLTEKFSFLKGTVSATAIGELLVKGVSHYRGVSLRDAGGMYWVAAENLDDWRSFATTVESTALKADGIKVYKTDTVMTEDTARTVQDAVIKEVMDRAETLDKSIHEDELPPHVLERRKGECAILRIRIAEYEGILGTRLESLREAVEKVERAATMASLQQIGV